MNKRILLVAALALAAVACGDDDGEAGPSTVIKSDGSVTNPVIDAGAGLDATTPQSDASTGSDSGSNNVKGAPGCFTGKPKTSAELLNACAEGYQVFDNKARLPNFTGTLPPLN